MRRYFRLDFFNYKFFQQQFIIRFHFLGCILYTVFTYSLHCVPFMQVNVYDFICFFCGRALPVCVGVMCYIAWMCSVEVGLWRTVKARIILTMCGWVCEGVCDGVCLWRAALPEYFSQ